MTAIAVPATRNGRTKRSWSCTLAPDVVQKFKDTLAARNTFAARHPQYVYDAAESDEERAAAIYYLVMTCGVKFDALPLDIRLGAKRLVQAERLRDPESWVVRSLSHLMRRAEQQRTTAEDDQA